MLSSILFCLLFGAGSIFFFLNAKKIRRNILIGKNITISDNKSERWKTMLLVAFGQKKMFSRPIPAILHFVLYAAFIITQIELLEIIIDGVSGNHRFFRPFLGSGFYCNLCFFSSS
jgi:hypothetical protein